MGGGADWCGGAGAHYPVTSRTRFGRTRCLWPLTFRFPWGEILSAQWNGLMLHSICYSSLSKENVTTVFILLWHDCLLLNADVFKNFVLFNLIVVIVIVFHTTTLVRIKAKHRAKKWGLKVSFLFGAVAPILCLSAQNMLRTWAGAFLKLLLNAYMVLRMQLNYLSCVRTKSYDELFI